MMLEIPWILYPKILGIGFLCLLILGSALNNVNDAKELLKVIFNKFFIIIFLISIFWFYLIYVILGNCLLNFYSFSDLILTFIFSVLVLCFTAFKLVSENNYFFNLIKENFKFNSLFEIFLGLIPQIFSLSFLNFIFEFIKSLILPVILIILFLPLIYIIALVNEYVSIYNRRDIIDASFWDFFKNAHLLSNIHKLNKRLNYRLTNKGNLPSINFDTSKSEFKLNNGKIYINDTWVGCYKKDVGLPKHDLRKNSTVEKEVEYIVDNNLDTGYSDDLSVVYIDYNDKIFVLCIKGKYAPLHIWSPLIEDIFEYDLLS